MKLRDYQLTMLNESITCLNRGKNPFVVAPTGSGKMIVIAALAKHLGYRVLIVEHRVELIKQAVEKLEMIGEKPGIIISGIADPNPTGRIKVGMIQTIHRKDERLSVWTPEIIIIDEAHLAAALSYKKLVHRFPNSPRICFSATPWRLDGKGFLDICDEIVYGPTITQLIHQNYLVPIDYLYYNVADFSGCKIVGNEYDQDQVASIMGALTEDIVNAWIDQCRDRSAVVFAANTYQSKGLCAAFKQRGIKAEHIDGTTPDGVRAAVIARVRSGETQVLCNCGIVVEGFDAPIISCVVLAIATRSLSKFLQCCGRGMRLHPESGKQNVRILDFGNCHAIHGSPEAEREWTLETRNRREEMDKQAILMSQYELNTYQPDVHDYGGNADDGAWHRKYDSTARTPRSAQQATQQPARALTLAEALRAGIKPPPVWLPMNWRDYWLSLEAYRMSNNLPIDYSERIARAEITRRARATLR